MTIKLVLKFLSNYFQNPNSARRNLQKLEIKGNPIFLMTKELEQLQLTEVYQAAANTDI